MTSGWSGPRLLRPDDGRFASWCRSYAGARRSRRTTRAGQQCLAARDQRMALSWPLPDSRKKCCSNTRSQRSWPRPSFYRARRGTPSRRAGRSCCILIGLNTIICADRAQSGALNIKQADPYRRAGIRPRRGAPASAPATISAATSIRSQSTTQKL